MLSMPPMPTWDGLHPLIVHFPVALLIVAPVFVGVGLLSRGARRPFLIAALLLMSLGTAGTWVAVPTGEAAAELADRTPEVQAAIERHEELAETTRALFTALTLVFAVIVLAPRLLGKELHGPPALGVHAAFLVLYAAGAVILANTAHQGGRLVHELGVRAVTSVSLGPPQAGMPPRSGSATANTQE